MTKTVISNALLPPRAVDTIKSVLETSYTFLKNDTTIVLACGKQPNESSPGGRDRILDYAKNHLKKFQFLITEKVFELLCENDEDLLSLEERLLNFCDCVLVVLESESTYAELGAFAIKNELAKIMLVINDVEFQGNNSFITLGPLAKINKMSRFRPVIHTRLKSILRAGTELSERLSRIEKQYNKNKDLSSFEKFNALPPKIRMLFLFDMITFFQPLTSKDIFYLLTIFYGNEHFGIGLDLHLLDALGLINKIDEYYFCPVGKQRFFFMYVGLNELSVRADVINHYHKYYREKIAILKRKVGNIL